MNHHDPGALRGRRWAAGSDRRRAAGKLTDAEHQYLLDRARENLAKATGETLENAGRALHQAAAEGEFVLQCGEQFATVAIYGRLLVVYARVELAGAVHPERN